MGKMPFHQLLGLAWRLSLGSRILWFFGFFLALSPLLNNLVFSRFFGDFSQIKWREVLEIPSNESFFPAVLWLVLILFIKVFGKSGLISVLPAVLSRAHPSPSFKALNLKKLFKNWKQTLFLEVLVFFFLIFLAIIFSVPAFFSYFYKPAAFETLVLFCTFTFFLFLLVTFFVKELALFYVLLSQLSIRAAVENGHALFVRFFPRCLAFGIYALALLLLFTFFLDLFILTLGESLRLPPFGKIAVSAFFLTWFSILYQALWFFFFRDLATPAVPEETTEKKVLLNEKVPEIPPVGNKGV